MTPSLNPYDYLLPAIPDPVIEPAKTAFVIVDMQYFDAHPDFGLGRRLAEAGVANHFEPFFSRLKTTVIPNIKSLQEVCRSVGIEVIFVKIEMQKTDLRDAGKQYRLWGFDVPRGSKEAQILTEIAPRSNEIVIHKTTTGAFVSTNLDWVLRNLGIEVLLFAGVNTNACVEMTVRNAGDLGYGGYVLEDCCAALSGPEIHHGAIARMSFGLMKTMSTAAVLDRIESSSADSTRHSPVPASGAAVGMQSGRPER